MTREKRRVTFPELLVLALLAVGAAWALQHAVNPAEKQTPEPPAETVREETVLPEVIAWDEGTVREELCRAVDAEEEQISFPYDCSSVIFDVFHEILADHPEFFWLTGSGSYTRKISAESVTVVFTPEVLVSREEIGIRRRALEERAADVAARASEYGTVYERLLFLHDLLVSETEYDSATADVMFDEDINDAVSRSTGAYGCLVDRLAVCSGYAAAFQLLAARIGIPCMRVQGTETKTGAPHEWNVVELDGEWTHIDVTWDDPVAVGESFEGVCSYDYFCVTTDEIAQTHVFDASSVPPCESDTYSWYRVNGLTLDAYDPDAAAELIARQVGGCIRLKFPDEEALAPAVEDLIERRKIFDIPAVREQNVRSLRYTASDMGTLTVWLLP